MRYIVKAILPFHHGRQCLMRYVFPPGTPLYEYDRNEPKLREYAKMAMESALVILRWGVESRIWMPYVVDLIDFCGSPYLTRLPLRCTDSLSSEVTSIKSISLLLYKCSSLALASSQPTPTSS